jgi:endonuclease/exonuclease/phosphatase (EEP) superfamily protein YafD
VLRGLLLFAFALALAAVAGFSFMPLLWRWAPQSVALVPAAPQFAVAAVILAVCFLLLKSRKAALLALAVSVWNIVQFWPALRVFSGSAFSGSVPAQASAAAPIKIISFNLWYANTDPGATLTYLAHSDADVIGLVEATPQSKNALAPLKVLYPYGIDCIGKDPSCEIMLLSKHPLRNVYAGKIDGAFPYIAEGEIVWGGRPVTIAMTHLAWPFLSAGEPVSSATVLEPPLPELPDAPRLVQSRQAANLARHVNGLPQDLVLMGDFNNASWSTVQQAFRAATGLDNRGHYLPSWPTYVWPIFRLPIDQVFVRGAPRVAEMRLGPSVGSDHLPIEAGIVVGP